ncbi:hypothetical protein TrLO_g13059 [Triparma laevis f. longispina]|uniref:Uncharacterized protein n=1 Tax=Triparma laevis f. longispina TaxID=1714387 RepID=A0A9W7KWM6_9STRA|nr:hypothetical protein TrLO_g13059 [Triparma laevis f. longispina]
MTFLVCSWHTSSNINNLPRLCDQANKIDVKTEEEIQPNRNADGLLDLRNLKVNSADPGDVIVTTDSSFPKGEPSRLMQVWAFFLA